MQKPGRLYLIKIQPLDLHLHRPKRSLHLQQHMNCLERIFGIAPGLGGRSVDWALWDRAIQPLAAGASNRQRIHRFLKILSEHSNPPESSSSITWHFTGIATTTFRMAAGFTKI